MECKVATEQTAGMWRCTQEAGHVGPCAAVPVLTLEDYFKREYEQGKIDHWARAHVASDGTVTVYIHPANQSGMTTPTLIVKDNTVEPKLW